MRAERFNEVVEDQIDRCLDILILKATEYSDDSDRLHNFKVAGDMQCCNPKQALAGMMAKHTVSVYDMCRSDEGFPIELWNEKITDSLNYLLLLKALVVEEKEPFRTKDLPDQTLLTRFGERPFI